MTFKTSWLARGDHATARVCRGICVAALYVALAGCGDDPTTVVFQVIEEAVFDPSLGIDLSQMERLANGVYRQDLVVGTGAAVVLGSTVTVDYTGWLTDGTEVTSATGFVFTVGDAQVMRGFGDGLIGMLGGGKRKLIIPPNLGFGGVEHPDVPAGSIQIYEVDLTEVR